MTDDNIKVVDRRWWAQDSGEQREDTRGSGKPTYLEDLEKQIAEKDKQIAEYLAKYRGAAAEFEEARLRLRREISKDTERSRREILADLLDVVDNLDRAMESARAGGSLESLVEGVEMYVVSSSPSSKDSGSNGSTSIGSASIRRCTKRSAASRPHPPIRTAWLSARSAPVIGSATMY